MWSMLSLGCEEVSVVINRSQFCEHLHRSGVVLLCCVLDVALALPLPGTKSQVVSLPSPPYLDTRYLVVQVAPTRAILSFVVKMIARLEGRVMIDNTPKRLR